MEVETRNQGLYYLNGTNLDNPPEQLDEELYKWKLSVIFADKSIEDRKYDYETVVYETDLKSISKSSSLVHSHSIFVSERVISVHAFENLKTLNLANNKLTSIAKIGLDAATRLRVLDLKNNLITQKLPDFGATIDTSKLGSFGSKRKPICFD